MKQNPLPDAISTRQDYEDALSDLQPYSIKPPAQATAAGILFYTLVEQIAAYEAKHFPLENNPMMSVH